MAEKIPFQSEGEQLESFLDELQSEQQIKEIAGWETGFANLNRALDGIRPGLYLLIGPPACGKTSFAKQLARSSGKAKRCARNFFQLRRV